MRKLVINIFYIFILMCIPVFVGCGTSTVGQSGSKQQLTVDDVSVSLPSSWKIYDTDAGQPYISQKTIAMETDDSEEPNSFITLNVFNNVVELHNATEANDYSKVYCEMWKSDTVRSIKSEYVELSDVPGYHSIFKDSSTGNIMNIYSFPASETGMVQILYIHPEEGATGSDDEYLSVINSMKLPEINYLSESTTSWEVASNTLERNNAVKTAQSYLNHMYFSEKGLIEQLEYEGFSHEDAVYAVSQLSVNWNEQAKGKAKEYQEHFSFSNKKLIEQLEYEGFTSSQAQYGAEHYAE